MQKINQVHACALFSSIWNLFQFPLFAFCQETLHQGHSEFSQEHSSQENSSQWHSAQQHSTKWHSVQWHSALLVCYLAFYKQALPQWYPKKGFTLLKQQVVSVLACKHAST